VSLLFPGNQRTTLSFVNTVGVISLSSVCSRIDSLSWSTTLDVLPKSSPESRKPTKPPVSNRIIAKIAIAIGSSVFLAFALYWLGWTLPTSSIEDKVLNFLSGFCSILRGSLARLFFSGNQTAFVRDCWLLCWLLWIHRDATVYATHNQGKVNPNPFILLLLML